MAKTRRGHILITAVLVLAFVFALPALSPGAAAGDEIEAEVGYIQLTVNGQILEPFYEVRVDGEEEIYLPLGRLLSDMELRLFEVDVEKGRAAGQLPYSLEEFTFDLESGVIERNGEVDELEKNTYYIEGDEVFIHHGALAEWLPLETFWDLQAMEMRIDVDFALMYEVELARQRLRASPAEYPRVLEGEKAEPALFGPGSLYLSFNPRATYSGEEINYTIPDLDAGYVGPFLYGDLYTRFNISQDSFELDRFRLTFDEIEEHPDERLVLGDTSVRPSALLLERSESIRGVELTGEAGHPTVTIRTEAPEDSDVDIEYRGRLIAHSDVGEDGEASFTLPVTRRSDSFEMKTFTPEGGLREEEIKALFPPLHLPEGESSYTLGAGRNSELWMLSLQSAEGVSENLTIGPQWLLLVDTDDGFDVDNYLGGQISYKPTTGSFIHLDAVVEPETGGTAQSLTLGFRPGAWNMEAGYKGYSGDEITPPARESVEGVHMDWEARLAGDYRSGRDTFAGEYRLSDFAGDYRQELEAAFRRSLGFHRRVELEGEITRWDEDDWNLSLEPSYTTLFNDIVTRTGLVLDYDQDGFDDYELYLDLRFDRILPEGMRFRSGLSYSGADSDFSFRGRLSYEPWDMMRFTATVDDQGSYQLGLGFNLMEIRESTSDFARIDSSQPTRGSVDGYVYLELEEDGQLKREPLENVGIYVNNRRVVETDASGYYRIDNLSAGFPREIRVDTRDLDALHIPRIDEKMIEVTAGGKFTQDFPVVPITGISGFIRCEENNFRNNGIVVVLRDEEGEIVDRTTPGFSGFYLFEDVPAGSYSVSVETPDWIELTPSERSVEIASRRIPDWYQGIDFRLERR